MDFTMMDVCRIRCGKIEEHKRSGKNGKPFWVRKIKITGDRGESIELNLFADSEDCLYLLDSDRQRIELPADPPNCERCEGKGQVAKADGSGVLQCPDCLGEGVKTQHAS